MGFLFIKSSTIFTVLIADVEVAAANIPGWVYVFIFILFLGKNVL